MPYITLADIIRNGSRFQTRAEYVAELENLAREALASGMQSWAHECEREAARVRAGGAFD